MTDNELLEKLFSEARQMEVADNGFTERVMRQVPDTRAQTFSRLWTAFCVVVAVTVFVLMRGWEIIAYGMVTLLNNLQTLQTHLMIGAVLVLVLGLLGSSDVLHRERYFAVKG